MLTGRYAGLFRDGVPPPAASSLPHDAMRKSLIA
jgi:hypothetical protein